MFISSIAITAKRQQAVVFIIPVNHEAFSSTNMMVSGNIFEILILLLYVNPIKKNNKQGF